MADIEEQEQSLKQVKAFTAKTEYFGIPADIVFGIVGFSVLIGATIRSPLMIIVFLLFFGFPAYKIHRHDPYALKVWVKALQRRHNRWCAGRSTPRELIILKEEE
jgi:type IV secretory pathway VirB3-like protein